MGQRSQIYVRVTNPVTKKKYLIARYFQWNYGERMVSRVRGTIEWIEGRLESDLACRNFASTIETNACSERTILERIIDVNFDMHDIVASRDIIKEYTEDYYDDNFQDVFTGQDNNDGQAFIDVSFVEDGRTTIWGEDSPKYVPVIKYVFTEYCTGKKPLTATEYLNWNYHRDDWKESLDVDTIEYTSDNIDYMDEHQLMTEAEVEEFRSYDYVSDMGLERKVEAV